VSPAEEVFIEFRQVWKAFGPLEVLRGVDLSILRGEVIVILGGSGTGKSVILRHIIGLMQPDRGQVLVDGTDVAGRSEKELQDVRRRIGMLFQGGALFDSMNVYENVAYALREHTDWSDERIAGRVREVLSYVDLEGIEEKMPSDLSGGMKKRVALARAVALQPEALLYDEPTTGLDPITSNKINDLILSLQHRLNVTSIVVTHDIGSAERISDRIAFLHRGSIRFVGTLAEARTSPDVLLKAFLAGEEAAAS